MSEEYKTKTTNKMCVTCYNLFERASGLILMTHSKEVAKLNSLQKDLHTIIKTFRDSLQSNTRYLAEVETFFLSITRLEGFQDLGLDVSQWMKKKNNNTLVETPEISKNKSPLPIANRVNLSPIPEARKRAEEKENTYRSPKQNTKTPLKPQALVNKQNRSLFSQENSLEDPSANLKKINPPDILNYRRQSTPVIESSNKRPANNASEIDRRINELEKEKMIVEKEAGFNDSPVVYNLPRNINHVLLKEGKSLETNNTNTEEERKISRTVERKAQDSIKKNEVVVCVERCAPSKSVKKTDRIALVYKVNTKQIDFDKYDRKKQSKTSTMTKEDTIGSNIQPNKSMVLSNAQGSSSNSSFIEDTSIPSNSNTLKEGVERRRDSSIIKKTVYTPPIGNMDRLDNRKHPTIDTPHF